MITLRSAAGEAVVSTFGAEPHSLRGADGHEYVWQAGPAWRRRAPIMFPIVGRVPDDVITVDGVAHPLTQHGFARDLEWTLVAADPARATLELRDSVETRERYPFAFTLTATYEMDDRGLSTTYAVRNPGDVDLPFSVGSHPAFAWPLDEGAARDQHVVEFERPEPAPIRRLDHTLVKPDAYPSPVVGSTLELDPALFEADAIVLDQAVSRSLVYRSPSGRALRVSWDDAFATFVIWSPPAGADFICLEPCSSGAAPLGFAGELATKPGVTVLPPGMSTSFTYRLEPSAP